MKFLPKTGVKTPLFARSRRVLLVFALLALAASAYIGCWYFERKLNYSFTYESMVRATVQEMVRAEALK